jgi:hypothetical protein
MEKVNVQLDAIALSVVQTALSLLTLQAQAALATVQRQVQEQLDAEGAETAKETP